jgi:hypothetical protein
MLRLDYLFCFLTILSTVLVGKKLWQGWFIAGANSIIFNPGCVLDGLTLNEIIQHLQIMREQAFADHICPAQDF